MSPRIRLLLILLTGFVLVGFIVLILFLRYRSSQGFAPVASPSVGTQPVVSQSDQEKLQQEEAARVASYPKDSDGDGLADTQEQQLGTDPTKPDTDGDGFTDAYEMNVRKSDPLKPDPIKPDERPTYLNPAINYAASSAPQTSNVKPLTSTDDADGDGLTLEQERTLGTDPNKADSDGDGLSDGLEVNTYHTNPLNPDSDGDGYGDAEEIQKGYNPLGSGPCSNPGCLP